METTLDDLRGTPYVQFDVRASRPVHVTALCPTPACAVPVASLNQLRFPAGALGDFFGPGTTVGIPFAVQLGIKLTF